MRFSGVHSPEKQTHAVAPSPRDADRGGQALQPAPVPLTSLPVGDHVPAGHGLVLATHAFASGLKKRLESSQVQSALPSKKDVEPRGH